MQTGSPQTLIGSEIDERYRILSILGEGGMGTVYLGEHIRIGRQVAIKTLNAALAGSEDFLERFEREAIAAGRLDHPNCVPVTDSGHLEDGTAYLVMELVSGESLGSVLESEGELPPIRALRIIRYTLRGLGHAHGAGIVHRDIKPDNIMLCQREEDYDFARVLDFGIAKLRDDESHDKAALTQAGMAVGTPAYLSPEQALGDSVDERSDLYSCAVVLFAMLCGRPPFEAKNPVGILTKHASEDPPHLWDVAPHLEVYPFLDGLVQKGLRKERKDRFQNAEEFIQAIDACLLELGSELTPIPELSDVPDIRSTGTMTLQSGPWLTGTSAPLAPGPATSGLDQPAQIAPTVIGPQVKPRRRWIGRLAVLAFLLVGFATALVLSSGDDEAPVVSNVGGDLMLQTYERELLEGKTCMLRLEAVKKLEALGDKRAIPNLKKARRRMRGGVLGIGKKNTNRCLTKAAKKAIATLESR